MLTDFISEVIFAEILLNRYEDRFNHRVYTEPADFGKWADENVVKYVGFYKKKKADIYGNITCTHCHKTFPTTKAIDYNSVECTCPECGKRLTVEAAAHGKLHWDRGYVYCILPAVINGIECYRVYSQYVHEDIRRPQEDHSTKENYGWYEDARLWRGPNGERVCTRYCFNGYMYVDIKTEMLSVKYNTEVSHYYASWLYKHYPKDTDLPMYPGSMHLDNRDDLHLPIVKSCLGVLKSRAILHRVVERCFEIPMIETLVKAGKTKMAALLSNISFEKGKYHITYEEDWDRDQGSEYTTRTAVHHLTMKDLTTALRIGLKHKYEIENPEKYVAYLDKLFRLGLDLHSPKYLCPPDFKEAMAWADKRLAKMDEGRLARMEEYQRLTAERDAARDARRKLEQAELKRWITDGEALYKEKKAPYLGIHFKTKDNRLEIHVLQSIAEFRQEGESMKHCVYRCGYYKNNNSLILSCRSTRTKKRVSTIELRFFGDRVSIAQNRACCNAVPAEYELINKTITDHFDEFIEARRKSQELAKAEQTAIEKKAEAVAAAAV